MYIAKKQLVLDDIEKTIVFDKGAIFKNKVPVVELYPDCFEFIDVKFKDYVKYAYTYEKIKTNSTFSNKDVVGNTTEELYVYNLQKEYQTNERILKEFYDYYYNYKTYTKYH